MTINAEGLSIIQRYEDDWWTVGILTAEKAVKSLVTTDLNEFQYAALVSFVVNVGVNQFRNSELLEYVNRREWLKAAREFPKWTRIDDDDNDPVLKRRRKLERRLFTRPTIAAMKLE
jgi:GH24 family phage-related lysozyme (muramidase)